MSCRARFGRLGIIAGVMMVAQEAPAVDNEFARAYTKLALLSVSDDINASSFRSEDIKYSRYSLPWELGRRSLSDNLRLVVGMRANWLDVHGLQAFDYLGEGQAQLTPRWSVTSLVGSGQLSYAVDESLTLHYGGSVGLLRFQGRSRIPTGGSQNDYVVYKSLGLVGTTSDVLQISPSAGITYQHRRTNGDALTWDGRVSWHALFPVGGERDSVKAGADTGTWSLRAEYRFARAFQVAATPVDILLSEQPGGFWGKGYRDIDFGFISETALAAEAPVRVFGSVYRVRVGAGWLKNDKGTGMSIIVNLR